MNSTDLLKAIKEICADAERQVDIDIISLSEKLNIPISKLVSILTELEQRDEIVLDVETDEFEGELKYKGHIKLMERPSDDLE